MNTIRQPLGWTASILLAVAITGVCAFFFGPWFRPDPPGKPISYYNLKQIITAAHLFAEKSESGNEFPRSHFDSSGKPMRSWQTELLPFLEEEELYKQIDISKPWDHPDNAAAMSKPIKSFLNPKLPKTLENGLAVSHYAGNAEVVISDHPKRLDSKKDFPRGVSNTIFAGEVATNLRTWGDPMNARDLRLGINQHPDGFGGKYGKQPIGIFAMADGSTTVFNADELAELIGKVPE